MGGVWSISQGPTADTVAAPQEVQLLSGSGCMLIMTLKILHLQSLVSGEQDVAARTVVLQLVSSVLGAEGG